MKVLPIVNTVLCVVLLGASALLTVKTNHVLQRVDGLEESLQESKREQSNEIARTYTRIGEIDTQMRTLADRIEKASSGTQTTADIEYQVKKLLEEERKNRRRQWRQGMNNWQGGMDNLKLDGKQREKVTGMMQKGVKDWMELQARVQAGEVTKEEARELRRKGWQDGMAKFNEMLTPEQKEKVKDAGVPQIP